MHSTGLGQAKCPLDNHVCVKGVQLHDSTVCEICRERSHLSKPRFNILYLVYHKHVNYRGSDSICVMGDDG